MRAGKLGAALCAMALTLGAGCSASSTAGSSSTTVEVAATSPAEATTSTADRAGASATPTTPTSGASTPTTGDGRTLSTLGSTACVEITSALLDLLVATTEDQASAAVAVLLKYEPPSEVQAAARHFIITKGGQVTDPEFSVHNATLKQWSDAVCP